MTTQKQQARQTHTHKPINPAFCGFKFLLLALIALAMVTLAPAQQTLSDRAEAAGYEAWERSAHQTLWGRVSLATNEQGQVALVTNKFIHLSPGLNRPVAGQFMAARPELVMTNGAVIGRGAQCLAWFAANLNTRASVQVRLPGGKWFKTHPLCLMYQNQGTNVLLATLKDAAPQILGHRVVYRDAFQSAVPGEDIAADVIYEFRAQGVSQNVVIRSKVVSPETLSLGTTSDPVDLLVVSEVVEADEPVVVERRLRAGPGLLIDNDIDLGAARLVRGRAFRAGDRRTDYPVVKQYAVVDGRRLILERVRHRDIAPEFLRLPPAGTGGTNSPAGDGSSTNRTGSVNKSTRYFAKWNLPPVPKGPRMAKGDSSGNLAFASIPGLMIDWELVVNAGGYFYSGSTYYIEPGDEIHLGYAYFEHDMTIKYGAGASLYVDGPLDHYWAGNPYAYLTSVNDDSIPGDMGELSNHNPTPADFGPALVVLPEYLSWAQENLSVSYAAPGIISSDEIPPRVSVRTTDALATKGGDTGTFTFTRDYGDWSQSLRVYYTVSGTAVAGTDYSSLAGYVDIPVNGSVAPVVITPSSPSGSRIESSVILTLTPNGGYSIREPQTATVTIYDPTAPVPSPVAAPDGLVGWWRAEDNANDSASTHHGGLLNGLGFTSGYVARAFDFDGVDDRVEVTDADALDFAGPNDDFSIEAWIRPLAAATAWGVQSIVDKRYTPTTSSGLGYALFLLDGKLMFQLSDQPMTAVNYVNYGPVGPDLRDGVFHHVAVTVDRDSPTGIRFYADGVELTPVFDPTLQPNDLSNDQPFRIGNHAMAGINAHFKGIIDEVSLYRRALTPTEIQAIRNAGRGGKAIRPTIITQPTGQIIVTGGSVTFQVVASGTAPLSYQWYRNGTLIPGATGAACTMASVQSANAGIYTVTVANAVGSVTSANAELKVIQFIKGINLGENAAAVTIEGDLWLSYSAALSGGLAVTTPTLITRSFTPNPSAEPGVATMLTTAISSNRLPADWRHFQYIHSSGNYDRRIIFNDVPSDYILANSRQYQAWCIQYGTTDPPGTYPCKLFHSYGSTGTVYPDPGALNKINYLINHRGSSSERDAQVAIWRILHPLRNDLPSPTTQETCQGLVNDANANGDNFVPTTGQLVGVVVEPDTTTAMKQPFLVEVPANEAGVALSLSQGNLPAGDYWVYLYLAESEIANLRSLNIKVQGAPVATGVGRLDLNHWSKLGPYPATIASAGGSINIEVISPIEGDPVLMGLAIYENVGGNEPPTINPIPDLTIQQNAGQQVVNLSGITAGGSESQPVMVTAVSANTTLIPQANLTIDYTSPSTTGILRFSPATGQSGASDITVTVSDGQAQAQQTFRVTVTAVPLTAEAGPDHTIVHPATVALASSAVGGTPPYTSVIWQEASGGAQTPSGPNLVAPSQAYNAAGTYTVNLTVGAPYLIRFGDNELGNPVNGPQAIHNPGNGRQVCFTAQSASLVLAGEANASVTAKVYARNGAHFTTSGSAFERNVAFDTPGFYQLQMTVTDSAGAEATDVATVLVQKNRAPEVDAGLDQFGVKPVGANAIVQLQGFVADDGLPVGNALTIDWTVLEAPAGVNPASVTFSSSVSPTAQASFSAAGRYVLSLAANDGTGAVTDTVTVFVCAQERRPKDIILVVEHSRYTITGFNYMLRRAAEFVDFVPLSRDRVSLVGFDSCTTTPRGADALAFLQHTLTHDGEVIKQSPGWVNSSDNVSAIGDGFRVATLELTGSRRNPDADPVIIFFGSLGDSGNYPRSAGAGLIDDAVTAATTAKAAGIRIITVGLYESNGPVYPESETHLQTMASNPSDYYRLTDTSIGLPASVKQAYTAIAQGLCSSIGLRVSAGADQTVVRPVSGAATIQLSGTAIPDEASIGYEWQFVQDWSSPGAAQFTTGRFSKNATATIQNVPDPTGTYVFRLKATQPSGSSGTNYVVVTVTTLPVDDVFTVSRGSENSVLAVLENDPNPGQLLIEHLGRGMPGPNEPVGDIAVGFFGGTLTISPDKKTVIYTPHPEFDGGIENFSYWPTHLNGAPVLKPSLDRASGQIRIFVQPVNEAPVANPDVSYFSVPNGPTKTFDVLYNDTDSNVGDQRIYPLRILAVSQPQLGMGSVSVRGDTLDYTPGSALGTAQFTYTIIDTYGLTSTGRVAVAITDDPSVLGWKAFDDYDYVPYTGGQITIDVLANDEGATTIFSPVIDPANGTVSINDSYFPPRVDYAPPTSIPSSPIEFSYQILDSANPEFSAEKHMAKVHVGFRTGSSSSVNAQITNLDPEPGQPVKIVKEGFLEVRGIAEDLSNSASYVNYDLVIYDSQNQEIRRFGTYTGRFPSPSGGLLGTLNLTTFTNGVYRVSIEATPIPSWSGLFAQDSAYILLDSQLKLGRFTLSVTDLEIPVMGIPLVIGRTYDSLDPSLGDFGAAWKLTVNSLKLSKNMALGAGWVDTVPIPYCIYDNGPHVVTITSPSGQSYRFRAVADLSRDGNPATHNSCGNTSRSGALVGIDFEPLPGTIGSLRAPSAVDLTVEAAAGGGDRDVALMTDDGLGGTTVFDTDQFELTTEDGRIITFAGGKVTAIQDRNKNCIVFDSAGVKHGRMEGIEFVPSGKEIRIVRDATKQNRISAIHGPDALGPNAPATLLYEYQDSPSGGTHLVRVKRITDVANLIYQTVTYSYAYIPWGNPDYYHYITKISGPNGAVRNEYDEQGRLIATIDPLGGKTEFDHGDGLTSFLSPAAKGRETITDPLGNKTIQEYDARGNIVLTLDALTNKTVRTYTYVNDRKTQETITDPLENKKTVGYAYHVNSEVVQALTVIPPHELVPGDPSRDEDSDFQTVTTFNERGQVLSVSDANNHGATVEYVETPSANYVNALGKVETITDALGKVTRFTYPDPENDGVADMIEEDPLANLTKTYFNQFGYVTKVEVYPNTGTVGSPTYASTPATKTEFTYTANGDQETETTSRMLPNGDTETVKRTSIRDGAQRVLRTKVERKINTGAFQEVLNASPVTAFDESGRVKSQTQFNNLPDGTEQALKTTYDYSPRGDLLRTTYPDTSFTESTYDAAGRLFASADRAGRVTYYTNNEVGRLVATRFPDGTTTTSEYDAAGRIVASRDRLNYLTTYGYEESGRQTSVTNAYLQVTRQKFDKVGNLEESVDALNRKTTYTYDAQNRLTRITYPDNTYQVTVFDDLGQRVEAINQDGVATGFRYDGLGRLIMVTNVSRLYDMSGPSPSPVNDNPLDRTFTSYEYDEDGNLLAQYDANQFDSAGNLVANARATRFEYDSFGRRTKRTLPGPETGPYHEEFEYNDLGSLVAHVDFNRKRTEFEYDDLGRLIEKIPDPSFANVDPVIFKYHPSGQRASMKYPLGPSLGSEEVTYQYRDDRLWKKITTQGTTQYAITYEYSDNGNLASLETSRDGVAGTKVAYKYDSLNRLKTVTHDPSGTPKTTSYDYDPVGNLESCLYPNAVGTSYAYNNLNQLRRIRSALGGTLVANFDYDEAGEEVEPATARASWGIRLLSPSGRRNRLVERISNAAQSLTRTIDYDYDKLNRLTQEILGSGSIRYDGLTPVGGSGSAMSPYDKVGNRRSRRSTVGAVAPTPSNVAFDHNDRLDNDSDPTSPSSYFDANGNTLKPDLNGDGVVDETENTYAYSYDFENHLVGATGSGKTISMVYDADGHRVKKTVNGVETRYLVDDRNPTGYAQVLEERDSAGNILVSYVYGLDLVSQKRGATTHYYGYDGLGTVRYLTDQDGDVSDTYTFDAFGIMIERRARREADGVLVAFADPASESAPAGTQPTVNWYRYTGEQFDADLSLYYLRARYYSPQIGRFWTMDTHEGNQQDPLSLHKYLYCTGNPVNMSDPSGMEGNYISLMSTIDIMLQVESLHLQGASAAMRKTQTLFGFNDDFSAIANGLDYLSVISEKVGNGLAVGAAAVGGLRVVNFVRNMITSRRTRVIYEAFLASMRNLRKAGQSPTGKGNCGSAAVAFAHAWEGSVMSSRKLMDGERPLNFGQTADVAKHFWKNPSRFEFLASSGKEAKKMIERRLLDAGPGAQGIVVSGYAKGHLKDGEDFGHMWNAVNDGGKIKYFDASASGTGDAEGYFDLDQLENLGFLQIIY